MNASKDKALLFGVLLVLLSIDCAFAQALQPIGTLTMPTVIEQPAQVFSAGLSYATPDSTGTAGSPPKVTFSTFMVTKLVDGTSPTLLVNAASARHLPAAKIDLFAADGSTVLTTYELSNVLILGAVVNSVPVGNARTLIEEVSLDYEQIRQTVFTPGGPVVGCWNRVENKSC